MATASLEIIEALRSTASALEKSNTYQWGHMGACNCGFLAQQITRLKKEDIHQRAMQGHGDWSEQLNDYCPTSGLLFDDLISTMLAFGFDRDDLKHLERLSDARILRHLSLEQRNLQYNKRDDVVLYLRTWAEALENELLDSVKLPVFPVTVMNVPF
jgi:hypothetical protein